MPTGAAEALLRDSSLTRCENCSTVGNFMPGPEILVMTRQVRDPRIKPEVAILLNGHTAKLLSNHLCLYKTTWAAFSLP